MMTFSARMIRNIYYFELKNVPVVLEFEDRYIAANNKLKKKWKY